MHFHFIMTKHSPHCSSTSPNKATVEQPAEDMNNTETSSSRRRRPRSSRQHPLKNGTVSASTTTSRQTTRNWNLLRKRNPRTPFSNSMVNKEFNWMETLELFWRVHPKDWMILAVSLVQRHVIWPLLERIRSKEQTQTTTTTTAQYYALCLIVCTVVTIGLALAASSLRWFLQQHFYLALFILYCQIAWFSLKWILYIYDDPAIHRGVAFAKGWLVLVVRRGTRALQSQDSVAFIMAVSTLKAAPVGVNFIRYAIRYRMRNLNNGWMDDITRRHVLFLREKSSSSFQQRLQESLQKNISFCSSLRPLRKLSDSTSTKQESSG